MNVDYTVPVFSGRFIMSQNYIKNIRHDYISGAAKLTSKSLVSLEAFVKNDRSVSPADFIRSLKNYLDALVYSQPFMASIRNGASDLLEYSVKINAEDPDIRDLRSRVLRFIKKTKRERGSMLRDLGRIGATLLNPNSKLLTYSASSSVLSVLKAASDAGIPFSVVLSEARPMREGVKLAKDIAALNIPVTLVIDILLQHYMASAQAVMIGADWISETQFTNKVGSQLLVGLALERELPVYVAATTDKVLAQKEYPIFIDEQPLEQILKTQNSFINVRNRYFESIPHDENILFITEIGILKTEDIVKMATKTVIE